MRFIMALTSISFIFVGLWALYKGVELAFEHETFNQLDYLFIALSGTVIGGFLAGFLED